MSRSASDGLLTAAYWLAPVALGVAGLVFYQLQNAGVLSGGRIAAAKVVWLGLPILFWYILPALIVVDRRTAPGIRRAYGLFLINMLIRGVAELWLMYESKWWDYRYGIGHDLFSMLLLVWLGQRQRDTGALDRLLSRNLFVCAPDTRRRPPVNHNRCGKGGLARSADSVLVHPASADCG